MRRIAKKIESTLGSPFHQLKGALIQQPQFTMNVTSRFNFSLPQADFVFTNYSSAVSIWLWLKDVVDTDMITPNEDYRYPIKIHGYIIDSLEGHLKNNYFQAPDMNDTFWGWIQRDGYVEIETTRYAYRICPQTLCQAVGWKSNSDMIDIGVRTKPRYQARPLLKLNLVDVGYLPDASDTGATLPVSNCQNPARTETRQD